MGPPWGKPPPPAPAGVALRLGLGLLLAAGLSAAPSAAAGDRVPTVCVATWEGPMGRCDLRRSVELRASGRTEAAATRTVRARLRTWLRTLADAAEAEAEGTAAAALAARLQACADTVDSARLACSPQPALDDDVRCWAELPRDRCWDASLEAYDGVGWKAAEQARERTCALVADELEAGARPEAERLRCVARCMTEVEVRCTER